MLDWFGNHDCRWSFCCQHELYIIHASRRSLGLPCWSHCDDSRISKRGLIAPTSGTTPRDALPIFFFGRIRFVSFLYTSSSIWALSRRAGVFSGILIKANGEVWKPFRAPNLARLSNILSTMCNNARGRAGNFHVNRNIDRNLFQGRSQRCSPSGSGDGLICIGPPAGHAGAPARAAGQGRLNYQNALYCNSVS